MRIHTELTELLGIDIPIMQAPVGEIATPALVSAVSNAGGFGMLSITWKSLDRTRSDIRATRALTSAPFGVNLVLAWDPAERLAIALEEGVPLVSFFWGDPSPYIDQIHRAGSKVAFTVGSAEEARKAVASGVDMIVAQGWEAGGHVWGNVATLPLIPSVVDAVPGTPVVAAGGIVDGRGLAAVLALGASGAWIGTRFLLSEEASAHSLYREKLLAASETSTLHSELFDGGWPRAPLRALRNSTVRNWEIAGSPTPGNRPGEREIVGTNQLGEPVARYSSDSPCIGADGDVEAMVMYAGQGVGILHDVRPAGAIVRSIAEEAFKAVSNLKKNIESEVIRERPSTFE